MKLSREQFVFPFLLALYEVCAYLSNDAYLPALPTIVEDLKTTHNLVQLTLTTWFMGTASLQLILGPISDRVGRRPVMFIGAGVFILSTLGCAFSHDIHLLLFWRFIQGAAITSIIIAGYATIHELYETRQAIHLLAIMMSITVLAAAFGPTLGALILLVVGWRWIFGILAIWAIFAVAGLFFKMPETIKERHAIHFGKLITQYGRIFCHRKLMLYLVSSRFLFAALIAWITASPFLLIDTFHFSPLGFGGVQILIFGGFILGTHSVKHLMEKMSFNKLVFLGLIMALLGSVFAFVTSFIWSTQVWFLIVGAVVFAFGSGMVFPVLERLGIDACNEPMGSRVAVSSFLMGVAGMLGSMVVGSIYSGSLLSLSGILLCFSFCGLFLQWFNRDDNTPEKDPQFDSTQR